jgi:hypothetical protein
LVESGASVTEASLGNAGKGLFEPFEPEAFHMIRIVTAAAVVAALVAGPAAAQSVRVQVAGKSAEQVQADVVVAARKVCHAATTGATFPHEMFDACLKATLKDASAQLANPNVKLAQR